MLSIIVSAYNVEAYISKCVRSILENDYQDFELIIIEDHSSDNTLNIIKQFKDNRIKLVINEQNYGAGFCRNLGCKIASGNYLTFIDGDDYIDNAYLGRLIKYQKLSKSDFIQAFSIVNNQYSLTLLNGGLFHKSIYKYCEYSEIRYMEDTATFYRWISLESNHSILPKQQSGYHQTIRPESLTKSHSYSETVLWNFIAVQDYFNFIKNKPIKRVPITIRIIMSQFQYYLNKINPEEVKNYNIILNKIITWNKNNNVAEIINNVKYI